MHNIEKIIYINLDKRVERREHMENQFNRMNIPRDKIVRLPGIEYNPGTVGCNMSHCAALKLADTICTNNVLILEDDFEFIKNINKINESLEYFFNTVAHDSNNWNGLLLTRVNRISKNYQDDSILKICINSGDASAYLVNKSIFMALSKTLEASVEPFLQTQAHWLYSNDVVWSEYMKHDKWFAFIDYIGYQRDGYSDLSMAFKTDINVSPRVRGT